MSAPRGGSVAAFFDMDRTLLQVNSGHLWLWFLRARGELSLPAFLQAMGWFGQYKLAILDIDDVSARVVAKMAGEDEAQLADKGRVFFAEKVAMHISALGRRALEAHRASGHTVALLTSATPYVAAPVAEALGIEDVLCTRLGVRDGRFDGTVAAHHADPARRA